LTSRQLQCYANVCYGLQWHGLGEMLGRLRRVEEDRVVLEVSPDVEQRLDSHPEFVRWAHFRNHGPDAYASWREQVGAGSMQITLHRQEGRVEAEIDYDYGNPGWDVVSLATHAWEYLYNCVLKLGRTNPFRIREILNKRGYGIPKVKE
jgi:hypothetical protein